MLPSWWVKFLEHTWVNQFWRQRIRHLDTLQPDLTKLVEPALSAQQHLLQRLGFSVKIVIGADGVPLELRQAVEKEDASLVVIGTHGRGMAFDTLLGGTAHKIIHSACFPLLVVRLQLLMAEREEKCMVNCLSFSKKILYVTDFSDNAQRAFAHLVKMVEIGAHRITLLHVQDKTRIEKHLLQRLDEFNAIDTQRLEMLRNTLTEKGAREVDIQLKYGMPVNEILNVSKEADYSFILMGSQGLGYVKESFLGSVSNNVVRRATLPVLLIPALR